MQQSYENLLHESFSQDRDTLIEQSIFVCHENILHKMFVYKIIMLVHICGTM